MKYTYVGKNVVITDSLKKSVEEKLSRLGNYFDCDKEAKVVMSTQKNNHKIEVTIYIKDLIIRAEEVTDDMYIAIDLIVDKLERKLRKQKTVLQKKYHKSIKYLNFNEEDTTLSSETNEIVKHKFINSKPMSDEEAKLQLELLNHDFYMYFNLDGIATVIYKRKDGNYGLIST